MTDLRSLDEHNRFALAANSLFMVTKPNGIACPNCGHELLDSNPTVCLTSWPPQYNTHCPACDYRGYRY
jgi:DNA-directed RNA polymerase subunit RPC12/RpoP